MNYQMWKVRMKLLLMKECKWRYVDRGNPLQLGEARNVVVKRVKDLHSIFMSVKENVFLKISECTDSIIAWTLLAQLYQQHSNAGKLILKDKLRSIRLTEGASVRDFICQIHQIQSELGIGDPVPDVELVERIMNTLPPSMDSVYQNVLGLNTMPSFVDLTARLLQAKSCAQLRSTTTTREDALAVHMQNLFLPADGLHVDHHFR